MNTPTPKAISIKELREKKKMLVLLEKAIEKSDFDRDTTFCKAVLTRINQHLNNLKETRKSIDGEKKKHLLNQLDRLINYYKRYVQIKSETWNVKYQ